MLVLAPTRELATQIQEQAVKFGRASGLSSTVSLWCLYCKKRGNSLGLCTGLDG
jgi:superfamily II DNA/RNA helicase